MDCPNVPNIKYGDFSRRLHHDVSGQRIPVDGGIEITSRCNLRCVHCYINQPINDKDTQSQELSLEEIRDILDQIVDAGCLWLLMTGGEPLVRPDFQDIYTHAKKLGLLITIFTNGTLITPEIAAYLSQWPPFSIEISLYGSSPEVYEKVTGVPGSFDRCIRGIELLVEHNVPLSLKSMAMTLNQHELSGMKSLAKRYGLDFRFDPTLTVRLDGGKEPSTFRLPPEKVVALDLADEKRYKSWLEFSANHFGPPLREDYLFRCGAGKNSFHIDSYGQLSACLMARGIHYNLRDGKFIDGWRGLFPRVRRIKWRKETPCKECKLHAICGWCPGTAEIETDDPEALVSYYCQVAQLRAKSLGLI